MQPSRPPARSPSPQPQPRALARRPRRAYFYRVFATQSPKNKDKKGRGGGPYRGSLSHYPPPASGGGGIGGGGGRGGEGKGGEGGGRGGARGEGRGSRAFFLCGAPFGKKGFFLSVKET